MSNIEVGIVIPGQGNTNHDPEKSINEIVDNYHKLRKLNPEIILKFISPNSFGLYAGIVIAGSLTLALAIKIANDRHQLVLEAEQKRAQQGQERTGMLAIIGEDLPFVRKLADKHGVEITNYNGLSHVVGGVRSSLDHLSKEVRRAVNLGVNGVYHSSIRNPEKERYGQLIEPIHIDNPNIPIIVSTDPRIITDGIGIKHELIEQLARCVDLTKVVKFWARFGVSYVIDIGPTDTMKKLTNRMVSGDMQVLALSDSKDQETIKSL